MVSQKEDPVLETLFYPVRQGDILLPEGGRVLLANPGMPCVGLAGVSSTGVDVWQYWKPFADYYAGKGFSVMSAPADNKYDLAFLSMPKQREEGFYALGCVYNSLKDGGVLVVAAANDAGGRRLQGDLAPFFPELHHQSKNKCRVVWFQKEPARSLPPTWIDQGSTHLHPGTGYWTRAGLFSWDRPDPGSLLLLSTLDANISGCVLDAGCGTGILGDHLLRQCPKISEFICIDADLRAVEVCRKNIGERHPGRKARFLWEDFSKPLFEITADFIVMNPPFHTGSEENINLGRNFIRNAGGVLKRGGCLMMVANAHLKYEDVLQDAFSSFSEITRESGFKVIHAVR